MPDASAGHGVQGREINGYSGFGKEIQRQRQSGLQDQADNDPGCQIAAQPKRQACPSPINDSSLATIERYPSYRCRQNERNPNTVMGGLDGDGSTMHFGDLLAQAKSQSIPLDASGERIGTSVETVKSST